MRPMISSDEGAAASPLSAEGVAGGHESDGAEGAALSGARAGAANSVVGAGLPREAGIVQAEQWMRRAIDVARSTPAGDIPVGAVILGPDGEEIGVGTNRRETDTDPLGHAEIAAIRQAVVALGDAWRLEDCTLVVTLEPCAMCAGALLGARIGRIVYGAAEPKTGACGSVWDLPREAPLHKAEVLGGVLREECETLLKEFFAELR